MATLLSLVQDVCDRLDLTRVSTVIGSTDDTARQLLQCANQEGISLARRYAWQRLTKETTFTTIAAETQTSALASDFDRFVTGTFYNRTTGRPVVGPMTAQEWADYKGRLTSIVFEAFRVRGSDVLIAPTPSAGDTMAYEYVSTWWCGSTGSTDPEQAAWAVDTDVNYHDDELTRIGICWRYLYMRGMDYTEVYQEYESTLALLTGRDGGQRTLFMGAIGKNKPYPPIPPDGSWNL